MFGQGQSLLEHRVKCPGKYKQSVQYYGFYMFFPVKQIEEWVNVNEVSYMIVNECLEVGEKICIW